MTAYPPLTGSEPCIKRPDLYLIDDTNTQRVRAAKLHCQLCPVIAACAEWALHREKALVWGGLSPHDRDAIRKRRGIALQTPTHGMPRELRRTS